MRATARRPILALDCDSVMTDYNEAVPAVWKRAFAEEIQVVRPNCYFFKNLYGLDLARPGVMAAFKNAFGSEDWANMSALPGVQEACRILVDKGYDLVCVTAMPARYEADRARNLCKLGLPISRVYAEDHVGDEVNPKLTRIQALQPVAFVDDLLTNFVGLDASVHKAWIDPGFVDRPNAALEGQGLHDTAHPDLLHFAQRFKPAR